MKDDNDITWREMYELAIQSKESTVIAIAKERDYWRTAYFDHTDRMDPFFRELERLRDIESERNTLREIAQDVANESTVAMWPAINGGNDDKEPWCAACLCVQVGDQSIHDDNCVVTLARKCLMESSHADKAAD